MDPKDFTLVIKSFERPACLARLVSSIREFYPHEKILVADDGQVRPAPESAEYELLRLPFDVGLSVGRNALVAAVQTPYFILLDDDFIFTKHTDVRRLIEIAERCGHDIVGGGVVQDGRLRHYEGQLEREGETLQYHPGFLADHGDHTTHDMVLNFFAGRTKSVAAHRWDPELKCAEHTAFFWRAKGKLGVAYCPEVTIEHVRDRDPYYNRYRKRATAYFDGWLRANGFKRSVNFVGTIYEVSAKVRKRKDTEVAP